MVRSRSSKADYSSRLCLLSPNTTITTPSRCARPSPFGRNGFGNKPVAHLPIATWNSGSPPSRNLKKPAAKSREGLQLKLMADRLTPKLSVIQVVGPRRRPVATSDERLTTTSSSACHKATKAVTRPSRSGRRSTSKKATRVAEFLSAKRWSGRGERSIKPPVAASKRNSQPSKSALPQVVGNLKNEVGLLGF